MLFQTVSIDTSVVQYSHGKHHDIFHFGIFESGLNRTFFQFSFTSIWAGIKCSACQRMGVIVISAMHAPTAGEACHTM